MVMAYGVENRILGKKLSFPEINYLALNETAGEDDNDLVAFFNGL